MRLKREKVLNKAYFAIFNVLSEELYEIKVINFFPISLVIIGVNAHICGVVSNFFPDGQGRSYLFLNASSRSPHNFSIAHPYGSP